MHGRAQQASDGRSRLRLWSRSGMCRAFGCSLYGAIIINGEGDTQHVQAVGSQPYGGILNPPGAGMPSLPIIRRRPVVDERHRLGFPALALGFRNHPNSISDQHGRLLVDLLPQLFKHLPCLRARLRAGPASILPTRHGQRADAAPLRNPGLRNPKRLTQHPESRLGPAASTVPEKGGKGGLHSSSLHLSLIDQASPLMHTLQPRRAQPATMQNPTLLIAGSAAGIAGGAPSILNRGLPCLPSAQGTGDSRSERDGTPLAFLTQPDQSIALGRPTRSTTDYPAEKKCY